MKNQDLAVFGVRLLGLFVLVQALQQILWPISMWSNSSRHSPGQILLMMIPLILLTGLGVAIFVMSPRIASRLAPDAESISQIDSPGLQSMLLATIGVFLMVRSIPSIAATIVPLLLPNDPISAPMRSSMVSTSQLTFMVTQSLAGILLFARADGLAAWWHRMRDSRYGVKA